MTQTFWIEGKLPGMNEVVDANRRNRYQGAALKADVENMVIAAIRAKGLKPVQNTVNIAYVWIEPDRRRDKDNIASARKFIQDALVKAGILAGDGWKHIYGFKDRFEVGKNPGVLVVVEEVEPRLMEATL